MISAVPDCATSACYQEKSMIYKYLDIFNVMKKRYNPSYREFMVPFAILIIGALLFFSTFWIENLTIRTIFVVIGFVLILYSVARILRIFLKIFLDQIRGW